jgi:uncharacterized protein YkwD
MPLALLLPLALASVPPVRPSAEAELLAELNFARTQPRRYADRLRAYRRYFRGKIVYYPGRMEGLRTAEGVRAVDEAIALLDKQAPLQPVAASRLLAQVARDHVREQGPRGTTGHISADGANPRDRSQRRGGGTYVAETITYGPPTAAEVVRQLIVDDDVPGRGHRRVVYATEMRFAGAACGPHTGYRVMCVVEFGRAADGR